METFIVKVAGSCLLNHRSILVSSYYAKRRFAICNSEMVCIWLYGIVDMTNLCKGLIVHDSSAFFCGASGSTLLLVIMHQSLVFFALSFQLLIRKK